MISSAYKIALTAHNGQTRRDGVTPYIYHPVRVMKRLIPSHRDDIGVESDVYSYSCEVALLHDVLEDTDTTAQEILSLGISPFVVECVEVLTKRRGEDYFDFIKRILKHPSKIPTQVKLADIIDNLSDNPSKKQASKYAGALQLMLSKEILFDTDFESEYYCDDENEM
jgi:(p)ppGpp synthase/HD superfamily hydrolase